MRTYQNGLAPTLKIAKPLLIVMISPSGAFLDFFGIERSLGGKGFGSKRYKPKV